MNENVEKTSQHCLFKIFCNLSLHYNKMKPAEKIFFTIRLQLCEEKLCHEVFSSITSVGIIIYVHK
jgi:hypothetical protein